jgi:hypothetical protein
MNIITNLLNLTMPFRDVICVAILAYCIGMIVGILIPHKSNKESNQ